MSDAAFVVLERALMSAINEPSDEAVRLLHQSGRDVVEQRRREGVHVRVTIADLEHIGATAAPRATNRATLVAEAITAAIGAYYGLR